LSTFHHAFSFSVNWANKDFWRVSKGNKTWESFSAGWVEEREYTYEASKLLGIPLIPPTQRLWQQRNTNVKGSPSSLPPLSCTAQWTISINGQGRASHFACSFVFLFTLSFQKLQVQSVVPMVERTLE